MFSQPKELKIEHTIHATLGIIEIVHKINDSEAVVYANNKGSYFTIDLRDTDYEI